MARVAFLIDEAFDEAQLRGAIERIRLGGHRAITVGLEAGRRLIGKGGKDKVTTDISVNDVQARDFDALVIVGGYSPDNLRRHVKMVCFARQMFMAERPVAAICRAGSLLVEADVADGRTVTSWPSIETDLINAGARWVNREVVEDGNLITSRAIEDLPAFCEALLRQLDQGVAPRAIPPLAPWAASAEPPDNP